MEHLLNLRHPALLLIIVQAALIDIFVQMALTLTLETDGRSHHILRR
jgi:hypothetical protein